MHESGLIPLDLLRLTTTTEAPHPHAYMEAQLVGEGAGGGGGRWKGLTFSGIQKLESTDGVKSTGDLLIADSF